MTAGSNEAGLNIVQVSVYSDLKFGGPSQKIYSLSRGLAERGHQVTVVTFRADRPTGDPYVGQDRIAVRYLPWIGRALLQMPTDRTSLRAAIANADVVHLYGLYDFLVPVAASVARKLGRPYLLEPLGMYVPRAGKRSAKQLYHRVYTLPMARHAARIVAASPAEADELGALAPPDRRVLRPNGLDLEPFQRLPDGGPFRAQLGMGPNDRLVLYLGRISPIKNLEALVEAFRRSNPERATLALVGPANEPAYEARLRAQIQRAALQSRVHLLPPMYGDDKLRALAAADLFVMPSEYESYGNAAAEAVAAGVPVLLTRGCGIAPRIDRRAGLAVDPDPDSLAQGLQLLLDDPARRDALTRARTDILSGLSWDEPLTQAEAAYRAVVEAARGRS